MASQDRKVFETSIGPMVSVASRGVVSPFMTLTLHVLYGVFVPLVLAFMLTALAGLALREGAPRLGVELPPGAPFLIGAAVVALALGPLFLRRFLFPIVADVHTVFDKRPYLIAGPAGLGFTTSRFTLRKGYVLEHQVARWSDIRQWRMNEVYGRCFIKLKGDEWRIDVELLPFAGAANFQIQEAIMRASSDPELIALGRQAGGHARAS